jgi:acyl carrier protein
VVVAREDTPGDKRLVAYLVPANGCRPNEQSLRNLIRSRLPAYMEPAVLVWIDSLPLTAHGKIDRAALPVPEASPDLSPGEYLAPRTPIEESIEKIIAEVLGKTRVSIDADFFALGAHSLLGAQVIARIRSAYGAELKLLDVFEAPTVAELAVKVEEVLAMQLDSMTEEDVAAALAGLQEAASLASQGR